MGSSKNLVEVKYYEKTPYGILRHPVFLRIRDDKSPKDCKIQYRWWYMKLKLSFMNTSAKRKKPKSKKSKQIMVKFKSDHTPIEIQRMSDQELEYLYEHGSPTERELADHFIQLRQKLERLELIMPMDAELAQGTGSPYAGGIREWNTRIF